ncbi:MAG: ankyrin repeat domain-containing protein, partial [Chitinophagaceae bacterium]|nr:ankyrin repeat domain-containing protein [Chitinophagaceae bacterium]
MAKKRVTLPKDFEELLKKNDLDELKAVFSKCEPDARGGYGKQTAFSFDECSHELAKWLVEQGADLEATDTWGKTALHNRSRFTRGNIESLLELGANIHARDNYGDTPLHKAASAHNNENTVILLQYGANKDQVNSAGLTPPELLLQSCRNTDIPNTVTTSKTYLDAGSQITPKMKEYVTAIGRNFEFHRAGFNKESVDEVSEALEELYKLFQVEPVAKRALHDGKSPITVSTKKWQDQHDELWELLVPSGGAAETIQGEVIRIPGRISRELHGNGGGNWD